MAWIAEVTRTHDLALGELDRLMVPRHDGGTGLTGVPIGTALRGSEFVFDPFDAYVAGLVTSPNVAIFGAIGSGKSTLVKMMLRRGIHRGRRAVVVDPKGEYGPLCDLLGGTVLALGNGVWGNPFEGHRRRDVALAVALLGAARKEVLDDSERHLIDVAWSETAGRSVTRPFHAVLDFLEGQREPSARRLSHTVRRFVYGDLAGLIDGEGESWNVTTPLVVMDLSEWWSSESLGVVALLTWGLAQKSLVNRKEQGYLVIDEAWSLVSNPYASEWLRGSFKMARAAGVAHLIVMHRMGDIDSAGEHGSTLRSSARGLLHDTGSLFAFRLDPADATSLTAEFELSERECRALQRLTRGRVLARYGAYSSLVALKLDAKEHVVTDTDESMR